LSSFVIVRLVDLDAEAIKLDLVLPVVADGHRFGTLRVAGLDELEEHAQILDGPGGARHT
jgi:hypothetical protein